jgi:hypothetical protein
LEFLKTRRIGKFDTVIGALSVDESGVLVYIVKVLSSFEWEEHLQPNSPNECGCIYAAFFSTFWLADQLYPGKLKRRYGAIGSVKMAAAH